MTIQHSYVVINALTAANIQQENTINDLKADLKSAREKNAELYIDKNKQIKQLEEAIANRPKYEQPLVEQLERQVERCESEIIKLKSELSNERFAAGMLRNYFIKSREDLIPDLSQHITSMAINHERTNAPIAGILALSPIEVSFKSGRSKQATKIAIESLTLLRDKQCSQPSRQQDDSFIQNEGACR